MSIRTRILEFFTTASNVVSRRVRTTFSALRRIAFPPINDWGRADYVFWRNAYRAQVRGLELSGLFIKPLCNKVAAWSIGRPPEFKTDTEATGEALNEWFGRYHRIVLQAFVSALKMGDVFVVVNSDLTLTILSPDVVTPIVADSDYSLIIGWRVQQVFIHPEQPSVKMTVTDEYYMDRRVHRVEQNGFATIETIYPNLLGRLIILHIANNPEDGQIFGRPEAEALVEILHRYGEVFEAAIAGNIRQGRPTPVMKFEQYADLNKFWTDNEKSVTQTLPDGSTETTKDLAVDLSQLLTVAGADFKYESPGSFAGDTVQLLELMFYLILQHTELPEFVMGNAIASSKASAETQMPIFERFIEGKRGQIAGWLVSLAEIVIAYLTLTTPGVAVEVPALQWQRLTQDGRLTLDTITWAFAEGLLDEQTALMLAPIDVEDIAGVLALARKEREERQQAQMDQQLQMSSEIAALETGAQQS